MYALLLIIQFVVRSLENEIDLKLVAFSKLGTNYSSSSKSGKGGDKAPLLGGDSKLEDVQGELNDLLAKLSQVCVIAKFSKSLDSLKSLNSFISRFSFFSGE